MLKNVVRNSVRVVMGGAVLAHSNVVAWAATTPSGGQGFDPNGGEDMPWNSVFDVIIENLTGKTAAAIGVLAMLAATLGMLFGGEMSDTLKTLVKVCFAIGVMLSGGWVMNQMTGSAALLPF